MEIIQKDNGQYGAFIAIDDDNELGEMTYVHEGDDIIIINHTGVEPEYESQGIGKEIFNKVVDFARENNVKVIPVCSFAVAMFKRTPEAQDVLSDIK